MTDDEEKIGRTQPAATIRELIARAEAAEAERDRLRAERRMIVSHATMGSTDGEDMGVNNISVRITSLRNDLYNEGKARAEALSARLAEVEAERDRLREALTGHQVWDKAEKVEADEFVLWAPDGCVAVRLKVTHRHDQLSDAGLEFLTCDLLDLLNARTALSPTDAQKPSP